ncbi:hypothetical protein B566_EDAN007821 [Ephemera danica]|nr:hypothetical protein B566_EDAN007821 [Ephemera danica]
MKCIPIFVLVAISSVLAHPRDGSVTTPAPHTPAAQRASCRNNGGLTMTSLNGRQYYFHTDAATKKNWHEAHDFCKQHCMDLATIETRQENDAITRKVGTLLLCFSVCSSLATSPPSARDSSSLHRAEAWAWSASSVADVGEPGLLECVPPFVAYPDSPPPLSSTLTSSAQWATPKTSTAMGDITGLRSSYVLGLLMDRSKGLVRRSRGSSCLSWSSLSSTSASLCLDSSLLLPSFSFSAGSSEFCREPRFLRFLCASRLSFFCWCLLGASFSLGSVDSSLLSRLAVRSTKGG